METATLTLADFLLARIAEDEERATSALESVDVFDEKFQFYTSLGPHRDDWGLYTFNVLPERVLAECEAKRRIVEIADDDRALYDRVFDDVQPLDAEDYTSGALWGLGLALRALATVYADHPDYRDEWRD